MDAFRVALEDCELDDLGFVGDPFTWRNNYRCVQGYIRETLGHEVANVGWRCLFPLFRIINGDPRHSDHCLTRECPLGTRRLVYRVRPIKEVENYKDSKMTWRRRRKALIRIRLGSL
jgi:hypothetical protein